MSNEIFDDRRFICDQLVILVFCPIFMAIYMIVGPLQILGWFFGFLDENRRVQRCSEVG